MSRHSSSSTPQPSPEALFRYRLVSQVRARVLAGEPLADVVRDVAAAAHADTGGGLRRTSSRSLYRWCAAYQLHGFAGLAPAARPRIERSLVLPEPLLDFIVAEKERDRHASIPELIRRAREQGVIAPDKPLARATVYRTLKRMRLAVGRARRRRAERDTRRFAYPHRMDMVLCDGKHFRAGVARARRLALFFLDDASRYGLHVVVGTSEHQDLFLRGLYGCIRRHGIAGIYYLDHGPGFVADDSAEVIANLGALLIHGEAAYPEGHGKIERFNQTAKHDVLGGYDGRTDVDPDPSALELRLGHYLREVYNQRPHESLGGKTPAERFLADDKSLRLPDSDDELRRRFVVHLRRRVSADHVVSVDGTDYEVPRGHAGESILIHRRLLDGSLAVLHDGKLVTLAPVDLAANARARRAGGPADAESCEPPAPKSAADMVFDRDLSPVVDADGGFTPTQED